MLIKMHLEVFKCKLNYKIFAESPIFNPSISNQDDANTMPWIFKIKFKNLLGAKTAKFGFQPNDSVEITTVSFLSGIPRATILGFAM